MNQSAWPFLVSRNRLLGYRTVVAPDFMVTAEMAGLLANEVEGNITPTPVCHVLATTQAGTLTLFYRVRNATLIDPSLRDEAGRPILWIEGVVFKGDHHDSQVTNEDLERVHGQLQEGYRRFWGQNSANYPVEPSSALVLAHEQPADQLNESVQGSQRPTGQESSALSQWLVSAVLSALLAVAVLVIVYQHGHRNSDSYLFRVDLNDVGEMNVTQLITTMQGQFPKHDIAFTDHPLVTTLQIGSKWTIVVGDKQYFIRQANQTLYVYDDTNQLEIMPSSDK
ncbi:MAG: hypothetical protein R3C14_32035 [Caldilineaceae bacterium]